jgi:hypothetical protein
MIATKSGYNHGCRSPNGWKGLFLCVSEAETAPFLSPDPTIENPQGVVNLPGGTGESAANSVGRGSPPIKTPIKKFDKSNFSVYVFAMKSIGNLILHHHHSHGGAGAG